MSSPSFGGPATQWLLDPNRAPRPLVVVEDHLDHLESLRDVLRARNLLGETTFVCLDRSGPDTDRMLRRWLDDGSLLVHAAVGTDSPVHPRLRPLEPEVLRDHSAFARLVAGALRPGGLLLQDVQLETLEFVSPDLWWETIHLACTVRGALPNDPPVVRFLSNKRGYQASFGARLMESGFDPRDVLDKDRLESSVASVIESTLERQFPAQLSVRGPEGSVVRRLARGTDAECESLAQSFDLLGRERGDGTLELRGSAVVAGPLVLEPSRVEWPTFRALLDDAFAEGPAPSVEEVGRRTAPDGALAAERSNAAARHVHRLRRKLRDPACVETRAGHYHLQGDLRVGRIRTRLA